MKFVRDANFNSQVLQSASPILVAFWAPWSKPCQVIEPVLLEVAQACAGRVEVVKINADDNPDLGLCLGIHSIPTLVIFLDGKVVEKIVGTVSSQAILSRLEPVLAGRKAEKP